jgi:hypothetical protein
MNKSLLLSGLCMIAAIFSQTALAADIRVRAGVSNTIYTLSGDYLNTKSSYLPVTLGFTIVRNDGLYLDITGSTGHGTHNGWADANSPTSICGGISCSNDPSPKENFKRYDIALIVGKNEIFSDSDTMYMGYKIGSSTLSAASTRLPWTEEQFVTSGVVFGGGFSFPINEGVNGSVGLNIGLGMMNGTWQDNAGLSLQSNTAYGGSYGVTYSFPITISEGLVFEGKGNKYSYQFDNSGSSFIVRESVTSYSVYLYSAF